MKNNFLAMAAGLFVLAGCERAVEPSSRISDYLVINADCAVMSKTDIDMGQSSWCKGDVITVVYDGKAYEYVAESDGETTVFTSEAGISDYDASKTIVAYYPSTSEEGTVTLASERNIEFTENTQSNPAKSPLVGTPKDNNLRDGVLSMIFENIFPVLELRIDPGEISSPASSLTIEPADNSDFQGYMSFSGTVDPATLTVTPVEGSTGNSLKMIFPENTDLTRAQTLKIPIGRFSTSSGLKLVLETSDGVKYVKNIYKTGITTYKEENGRFYSKHLAKELYAFAAPGGIATADDLVDFANAVNEGKSLAPWMNKEGKIVLLNDIDMAGVTSWKPIGQTTFSWASNVLNLTAGNPFVGYFDGQGHTITNFKMVCDNSTASATWGLFGTISKGGVVENLVIDSTCSLEVKATAQTDCGVVAGLVYDGSVRKITNNASMSFDGNAGDKKRMTMSVIGFAFAEEEGVDISEIVNNGAVTATGGGNTQNGATGVHVAGILGFSTNHLNSKKQIVVSHCVNNADLVSASARMSGLVAASNRYTVISDCVNYGNSTNSFSVKNNARVGNVTVLMGVGCEIHRTINYGNVICTTSGGVGGIVCLPNSDDNKFIEVENYGNVISDNLTYRGTFFGQIAKNSIFENCIGQGDAGTYNNGEYVMVGTNAENYFDYIGIIKTGADNATRENIRWSK